MADVTGQQMRGPTFYGRQKDRPVFFGKVNGTRGTGNRGYDPDLAEDGFQTGQAGGEFNGQISARLFGRKGRCQGLTTPLRPEFHNERSLPQGIVGRREEYIGIQENYWRHIHLETFAQLPYSSFRRRPESIKFLIILDTGLRRYDIIAGFM